MKKISNELLIPNQDVVFQALFGTKGSENILRGLLTNILGQKVEKDYYGIGQEYMESN